jgi:hypothetical protein
MRKLLGFVLLVACAGGCAPVGVARHVLQVPDGGVIAMPSNAEWHRAKAHDLMTARFPQGYEIDREEEVVVGQTTTHNTRTDTESMDLVGTKKLPFGTLDTSRTTKTVNTHDQTEYRIHYRSRHTQVDMSGLRPVDESPAGATKRNLDGEPGRVEGLPPAGPELRDPVVPASARE